MCGFLMVRMLGLVVERLCGGHTADHNETDDQEAGEGTLKEPVRHNLTLEQDRRCDRTGAGAPESILPSLCLHDRIQKMFPVYWAD